MGKLMVSCRFSLKPIQIFVCQRSNYTVAQNHHGLVPRKLPRVIVIVIPPMINRRGGVDTIPKLYPREIAMEISPFWWVNHRTSKLLGHLAIALWDGSKPSITYILTTFGGTIIHEITNFGVPSGYHPGTRALTHSHITRSLSLVNSSGELAQPTQSSSLRSSPMHKTNSTSPNICETCPDLAELGQTRHKADK